MPIHRYELRFDREGGCPLTTLQGMASADGATVITTRNDLRCEPGAVRVAILLGDRPPTLDRWSEQAVGASLRWHREGTPTMFDRTPAPPRPKAAGRC